MFTKPGLSKIAHSGARSSTLSVLRAREGRRESGASLDEVHVADIARAPLLTANAEKCSRSDREEVGKGDRSGTS
jgi:hypothetical protein